MCQTTLGYKREALGSGRVRTLLDFVKQAGSDGSEHPNKVTEHDRKAATLLNPCIYKRRRCRDLQLSRYGPEP
jgi:hypothetical protein